MRPPFFVILTVCLVLGASFPREARAEAEAKSAESRYRVETPGDSNFDRLESLFQAGTMPSFPSRALIGFAGRCFDREHADAIKGAAYLVRSGSERNGPIDSAISIETIWEDQLDYFDHLSARSFDVPGAHWYPACEVGNSLTAVIGPNSASSLRQNGKYWIEKISTIDDGYASYYCYYFLTLTP